MFKTTMIFTAATLAFGATSAAGQDYARHQVAMESERSVQVNVPEGANATFNFRKTFGGKEEEVDSSFGFTMAFGQQMGPTELNGAKDVRTFKVMDLRFDDHGARNFDLVGSQLTDFGRDDMTEFQKSQLIGDSTADGLILLYIAVPVAVVLLATS